MLKKSVSVNASTRVLFNIALALYVRLHGVTMGDLAHPDLFPHTTNLRDLEGYLLGTLHSAPLKIINTFMNIFIIYLQGI